jgi:hypothetical protein
LEILASFSDVLLKMQAAVHPKSWYAKRITHGAATQKAATKLISP